MGQLKQPVSAEAHPVRRVVSAWRLVPLALGTAAVIAGCGAGGHRAPSVAASSAHAHPATGQAAATGQTGPRGHVTIRRSAAKHAGHGAVSPRHHASHAAASSGHHPSHAAASSGHHASRVGASSAHTHLAISQAAVTGQIGPGPQVTIQPSSAKRSGADVQTGTPRPGAMIRTITGTHNATIGTLAEGTSVVLVWTASEGPIQIFTSQGNLLLSSHARNGTIRLAEGQYHGLRVASPGAWTLRLHAAA
jgi:hypothetical protein